ncbi:hypothetical protein EUGRSUZ_B00199 [Eucalyptus grandis]|uniref:Uncharacterized protein n=2 Tax=Eucalyptus grandis TaxID=71139 RepID=A0ACC3LNI8_EUCGR|nr:hypothetical protein EUGRSUZ_B00199 [Eucalyptus grandis]
MMSSALLRQYLYPLLIPFTFCILLLFKWLLSPSTTQKHHHPPPSPPRLPILGNLHQIGSRPHSSLANLSRKHGPLMLLRLGRVPVLVVSSADAAREIMKTHDLIFANRPKSKIFEKLVYDYKDLSMAPYGEYWRQMKSVFVLQLLSNKRVQSFRPVREEEVANLIADIEGLLSSASPTTVNLGERFAALTNDVVCRVALGRKYGGKRFKAILMEFVELLGALSFGDYIPWLAWVDRVSGLDERLDKVAKELDGFLDEVVEEHVEKRMNCEGGVDVQEGKEDFVDILLSIQKDSSVGFSIDKITIKALILLVEIVRTKQKPPWKETHLFANLGDLLPQCPLLSLQHIRRTANLAADWAAKAHRDQGPPTNWLLFPPPSFLNILSSDVIPCLNF